MEIDIYYTLLMFSKKWINFTRSRTLWQ